MKKPWKKEPEMHYPMKAKPTYDFVKAGLAIEAIANSSARFQTTYEEKPGIIFVSVEMIQALGPNVFSSLGGQIQVDENLEGFACYTRLIL